MVLRAARVLFGLLGLVTLAGAVYFTFFAPAEDGGVSTGADWAVAVWSALMSIGYIVAAVLLGRPDRRIVFAAIGLVLLHLAFGFVKLIGYNEVESVPFFAADLLILGLLGASLRTKRHAAAA